MARGNRHQAIYREEDDYHIFLKILKEKCLKWEISTICYCLMTNHFHLILDTGHTEIWKFMWELQRSYAMFFNQKYHFSGHLYEKRYTSCLIEDPVYLLEASRYIHLNPVKAGMVRQALDYPYSSSSHFVGNQQISFLNSDPIWKQFLYQPQEQYRRFVESEDLHREREVVSQKEMGENDQWLPW